MSKTLPKDLTSYDLLKALAVIIMVVDHIGWYFSPDDNWWRAVGRIGFPVWFFLVGHASGRMIGRKLWGAALVLVAVYLLAGSHFLPFNALVTIIVIRLIIDPVMSFTLRRTRNLIALCFVFVLLMLPSNYITEYGAMALIFAMAGYLVRHYKAVGVKIDYVMNFIIFAFFSFIIPQFFIFGLSIPQFYGMAIGTAFICICLYHFRLVVYPRLTAFLPRSAARLIQFMGRRTLEIYVVHIVLFQIIVLMQGDERFGLFDWKFTFQF